MLKQLIVRFFAAFALVTAALTFAFAQSDVSQPLQNEKAIEQLKQNGHYDSLVAAVKAARADQNDDTPPASEFAVGQSVKLIAGDGAANDNFGYSVAISGETAVVGSYSDDFPMRPNQGSAYVFVRNGATWTEQAKLIASDGAAGDRFGISVAINGNTIVVGANGDDYSGASNRGSAYVFTRSGTTWSPPVKITAAVSDSSVGDEFGNSVSISGDFIVVGAYVDDNTADDDQGSAYIFARDGSTWTQQQKILAADGAATDYFGFSVAISGDTAVIGAYLDDVGANADQGSVYVYVRNGSNWTLQQNLAAADGAANDQFGRSVSISGESVIAGVPLDDIGSNADQGSAYVYLRSNTIWAEQAKLTAANAAANDQFGSSVALSGEAALIGAKADDVGANADQGAAYVFTRSNAVWTQQQQLLAADGATGDEFGLSVALSGNNLIVGSHFDDIGARIDQGSAYFFRVLSGIWTQESKRVASDGAQGDLFGYSVALSGDTAIVSAVLDNIGSTADQGSAYIFVRSGTTWTQQAQLIATDGAANDNFGNSVAISGDTAVVGAFADDNGSIANQGAAYVFVRSGTTWTQQAKFVAGDGAASDLFGYSVAVSGNTAIVGSIGDDIGSTADQGSAYVYLRSGTTWSQQAKLIAADSAAGDQFGSSVSVNNNTAVVGAFLHDIGGNANQGAAYVYLRDGATWAQQAKITDSNGAAGDQFGFSVAADDDTVVVGAFLHDTDGNNSQGAAYVYLRSGTIWTLQVKLVATDGAVFHYFGYSVAISDNLVLVGAIYDDIGANDNQGSAYVFERNGATWTQRAKLTDSSGTANDNFGYSVALSGDKIVIGAPYSDASVSTPFADDQKKGDSSALLIDQGAAIFFINDFLPPTAASVTIGGRVFGPTGRGLANAFVYLTDDAGEMRLVRTNFFGFYRFTDVPAGTSAVISAYSKRFAYAPQAVSVTGEVLDLNFHPIP